MNIKRIPPFVTDTVQNQGTSAKPVAQDKNTAGSAVASDRLQLSQNYQDLAQVQKTGMGTSDIRTDRVQEVKSQLEAGNYQIKPSEIADKMLDEII